MIESQDELQGECIVQVKVMLKVQLVEVMVEEEMKVKDSGTGCR